MRATVRTARSPACCGSTHTTPSATGSSSCRRDFSLVIEGGWRSAPRMAVPMQDQGVRAPGTDRPAVTRGGESEPVETVGPAGDGDAGPGPAGPAPHQRAGGAGRRVPVPRRPRGTARREGDGAESGVLRVADRSV